MMLLTYTRFLVSLQESFPKPPGEIADISVAGDVFQHDLYRADDHFQEFPSSHFTAVVGLGPGFGFPNKLKTDISEDKLTHISGIRAWRGLRPFLRK